MANNIIPYGFGFSGVAYVPLYGFTPNALVPCLTADVAIRMRYGTGRHYGTGWRWGGGTISDPYVACGDPCFVPRFVLEDLTVPSPVVRWEEGTLFFFDSLGQLSARHGGYPHEVFYLRAPNSTSYRVTLDGDTGDLTYLENLSGVPIGKAIVDQAGTLWRFRIDNDEIIHMSSDLDVTADSVVTPTFTAEALCG